MPWENTIEQKRAVAYADADACPGDTGTNSLVVTAADAAALAAGRDERSLLAALTARVDDGDRAAALWVLANQRDARDGPLDELRDHVAQGLATEAITLLVSGGMPVQRLLFAGLSLSADADAPEVRDSLTVRAPAHAHEYLLGLDACVAAVADPASVVGWIVDDLVDDLGDIYFAQHDVAPLRRMAQHGWPLALPRPSRYPPVATPGGAAWRVCQSAADDVYQAGEAAKLHLVRRAMLTALLLTDVRQP